MQTINRTRNLAIVMVFALALAISTMSFVLAEDNQTISDSSNSSLEVPMLISENSSVSDNSSAADLELNGSVSGGEITWKQLKLLITLNKEKRIEGELELARLRLIQARMAADKNDSEAMLKAIEAHQRIMDRVQTMMDNLANASDGSKLNETATKMLGLERAIQVHERRINFLNSTLENANLTDEQKAKIEEKIEKEQTVNAKLDELQQAKLDKLKTRLMAVANLTDEQANKVLELMKPNKEDKPGRNPPRGEDRPRNDSPGQGERGPRAPPRAENGSGNDSIDVPSMPGNESD